MLNIHFEIIEKNEILFHFKIKKEDQYLSFREVLDLWKNEEQFSIFYKEEIIRLGFDDFYWEHPALSKSYLDCVYECICKKSSIFSSMQLDERAFSEHIHKNELVVHFPNLGKNAELIVPTKQVADPIYLHLGLFLRKAPLVQINQLFKEIASQIYVALDKHSYIWLNTAGLGVIWLHVRLDTSPKYYKTMAFKNKAYLSK